MAKILIIDDNEDMRDLLRTLMEREGADVYEAADGVQGLARFKTCRPDLVVLDVVMPLKHGLQVLAEIRYQKHPARILLMSGGVDPDAMRIATSLGADKILLKPFRNEEFLESVQDVLQAGMSQTRSLACTAP